MRRTVAVSIALLLLAGCGGKSTKANLAGKLTYKGQPVNSAALYLFPVAGGEPFLVPVGPDGSFTLSGLAAGDYKVVVEGSAGSPGPSLQGVPPDKMAEAKAKADAMKQDPTIKFPDKYKKKETTTLKVTLGQGTKNQDLELTD